MFGDGTLPGPLLRLDNFGDFLGEEPSPLCEDVLLLFAAMFFSEGVIPSYIVSSASAMTMSVSIGVDSSDSGRFPRTFFLGLGGGMVTGDGDKDGSFSFEAIAGSSSSSSETLAAEPCSWDSRSP